MTDSHTVNWDVPSDEKVDIVDYLRSVWQRIRDRQQELIAEEEAIIKSDKYVYSQVWLISREQFEKLPDNPTWYEMYEAGAIFQGYQWVKKDEQA